MPPTDRSTQTRKSWPRFLGFFFLLLLLLPDPAAATDFESWLRDLRREAGEKGISEKTLDQALTGIAPIPRVLELDRKQPEFSRTLWGYLDLTITEKRIQQGRDLLVVHEQLLAETEKKYGVQPRFLVAFWGLETNFGSNLGGYPVISALATLAHDPRRSAFFRQELFHALTILDQGHISATDMMGSWAGAMGQVQFMPSTFVRFAVDGDNDGRRDIWGSLPDAFSSAANFLSSSGWEAGKSWGREVRLPEGFDLNLIDMKISNTLSQWRALGVRETDGYPLPLSREKASLLLPAGFDGPAFLVFKNYRTILNWNRSNLYAIAVGHLADRLTGGEPFVAPRPENDRPLHRNDVIQIQQLLAARGLQPGPADGIAGSMTKEAIREFQRTSRLPVDGYPSAGLLERLQSAH